MLSCIESVEILNADHLREQVCSSFILGLIVSWSGRVGGEVGLEQVVLCGVGGWVGEFGPLSLSLFTDVEILVDDQTTTAISAINRQLQLLALSNITAFIFTVIIVHKTTEACNQPLIFSITDSRVIVRDNSPPHVVLHYFPFTNFFLWRLFNSITFKPISHPPSNKSLSLLLLNTHL